VEEGETMLDEPVEVVDGFKDLEEVLMEEEEEEEVLLDEVLVEVVSVRDELLEESDRVKEPKVAERRPRTEYAEG
jgi:dsDNA-specific endonuclease/ATPase MutS2